VTEEEAIARVRARWAHPPLDVRDVEERVALRLVDAHRPPEVLVRAAPPACRLFVRQRDASGSGWPPRPGDWRSKYVHALRDVDRVLDDLGIGRDGVVAGLEAFIQESRAHAS
jgi:hypothetical protein